jgi:thiosulfate dehydrogenase [quinone] large subunit
VQIPDAPARPPVTYDWYRDFLNLLINNHAEGWFALLVTFGEIAVGVALILGIFTGLAAFFGALMNVSYLLAGSTSSNPVLFTMAIGVMLAWKTAGYYGLDRYLLPRLGTPWATGSLFHHGKASEGPPALS